MRRRLLVTALALAVGCATSGRRQEPSTTPAGGEAFAGWQALAEGRRADAERSFAAVLSARPRDPIALFGRATLAYEGGATEVAVDGYTTLLAALASGAVPSEQRETATAMAPVAAGRIAGVYDDLATSARERLRATLRPAELARSTALPWQARAELARLAAHAARQLGDAGGLAAAAAAGGCARLVFDAGRIGALPNLDLDTPAPARPATEVAEWRTVTTSGCRLDVPAAPDGRGGARLLRAAIEVPAGPYDLVLDYPGEARIAVDGGAPIAHGASDRYGPRVTGARIALEAGRHTLEVRIAGRGGRAALALLVLPGGAAVQAGAPVQPVQLVDVRFVDPRPMASAARPGSAVPAPLPPTAPLPGAAASVGERALADYCAAYTGARMEAADQALEAVRRIEARPRFAVGLALAGNVAREDPTRPTSFARDAARRLLRAALAADAGLARAWQTLANVELDDERPREAAEAAGAASRAAPTWWAPDLVLARALAARGLDFDADRALEEAARKASAAGPSPSREVDLSRTPCPVLESLRRRAGERRALAREARLAAVLVSCGGHLEDRVERLRARGEVAAAIAVLRTALRLDPDRDDLVDDLALLLAADGRSAEGLAELAALVSRAPNDPWRRVRLADAQAGAGQGAVARTTIKAAVEARPDVPEVRRAARALGIPGPLDDQRVDGREVIRAFEAAGARYAAPAVMVLDRSVMRAFSTGAMVSLTHQIVRVDSKEAIDRWGEINIPPGAEILTLRTHKPDGSTREPEEIAGKEAISAPDLALGDYVEWEFLETHAPSRAFAPGFLADRFYFQSFDSPLARTELILITPAGVTIDVDRRGDAPRPETTVARDGARITRFAAQKVPQLFAERAAVLPVEYVPSVRVSSGVDWRAWARYVAEELRTAGRSSPDVRAQAAQIAAQARVAPVVSDASAGGTVAGGTVDRPRAALAARLVAWVTENIEGTDDFSESASFTLARGRGSRLTLALALARELGIPARIVLARSRLVAETAAATPAQELDDFADALLELDVGAPGKPALVQADLRLRHAAFGYLPPGLDGARALGLPDGGFKQVRSSASGDRRTVDMTIRLDEHGGGVAMATEDLVGWPALEWAELVAQVGADRSRLRQDFEQRWLGVQFPGARLRELEVELPHGPGQSPGKAGRVGTARLRYSFVSNRLAVPVERASALGGREMRIDPTFFRSQPGRRFAAEPQRATALVLGFDVPVRMTATVELPGAARVDDAGLRKDVLIARDGGYRFVEERSFRAGPGGRSNVLVLHRESMLPIMRVSPGDYPAVAADLRRVDGAEQEEIRIRLAPGGRGGAR